MNYGWSVHVTCPELVDKEKSANFILLDPLAPLWRKCTGETWPPVTSHNFTVGLMFSTFKSKAMVLICWKYDKNMEELPLIISQMLWSTVKIDYKVETEKESKHFQMRNIKMSIFYTFPPFSHFIKEKCYYYIFYF